MTLHYPASFGDIYDKYAGSLYGTIIRKVETEEEASIILEKVFLIIFNNLHLYCPQHSTLFTWMMNILQKEMQSTSIIKTA